jgi:hypothetical protein
MICQINLDFTLLMVVMLFGFLVVCILLWKIGKYLKENRGTLTKSGLVKTKGEVVKKFFGGGDSRISGDPHMTFKVIIDNNTVEIDQKVGRDLYFSYDEGDEIELFIAEGQELKVYPLESIQS